MRLINIETFLERECIMNTGGRVDPSENKVLDSFADSNATKYAILSHRWMDSTEVNYKEIVGLEKMDGGERDKIRRRLGYKKILDTCEQAKSDGYEWLWVDTSTNEAAQSCLKQSIRCTTGMGTRGHVMCTSTMSPIRLFPHNKTSQFWRLAGVVFAWMDATGTYCAKECPVL